ncbi:E3 ubiquitin-protein ligase PUB24-like [Populus alba x Populus x berolinensis]|uniref:U-box domain-containing protein n=1 Tax=Populus alba x Populus x berolinensis TaxID=444605 RepID=A0AAD6LM95_9ROSI|nr:E3 ubiquitin-protein ligase PUB24-like [Populus alba x Populus x berolinensis]
MDDIEVPRFFICPIYLQIMKDPVTTITGITYDRESIERWLFTSENTTCPVTKQSLPKDSDLTPNHTLRRLIQAWCTENASNGVDRIPTPKPCLDKAYVLKLIKNLSHHSLQIEALTQMEVLAAENERNRKCMVDAGLPKAMLVFIVSCFENGQVSGIQEALCILRLIKIPRSESRVFLCENVSVLRILLEDASSSVLKRLKPEFFERIVGVLREKITQQGIKDALEVLLEACPWAGNRKMMVESGAVFELIELELGSPQRRTTELNLGVLFHLCCCAEGRAQFLSHGGSIAVVAKRILRVSPEVNDRAILILSLICKFSGTSMVIQEMVDAKAVPKLCMLLQADCAPYLKNKAREILRSHFDEWKNFPCIFSSLSCLEYKEMKQDCVLDDAIPLADTLKLVSLKHELFDEIVQVLRDQISHQASKATLQLLISLCPWGRNRIKAIEAKAVPVLIDLLLDSPEKRTCEMVLMVLDLLCQCAEGRAELLGHGAGLAIVSKKILRVSQVASERAVRIILSISKYSITTSVLQEMLQIGIVAKLCLVLQVDCGSKIKDKAREVLKMQARVWKSSPCIPANLLSSYPE